MKDSIILEGKTYISARRAALVINYAQDYIGQLCRANKLDCKMVARSWFVTEDSLTAHRQSALKATNERVSKIVHQIELEKEKEKVESILPPTSDIVPDSVPFKYEPVIEPLLPELEKKIPPTFSIPMTSSRASTTVVTRIPGNGVVQAVLAMALLALSGFLFISSLPLFNSGNSSSLPASIASAGLANIVDRFLNSLAVPPDSSADALQSQEDFKGIGIVPSSNSMTLDEQSKGEIRNSFSDEVVVHPDESGTAGIITPVFRKANGKDFVYVLVPVKPK